MYVIFPVIYVDINECNTNKGGCEHSCSNTPGSYSCSCNTGYSLDLDNRGCSRKEGYYTLGITLYYCIAVCDDSCHHCISCDSPDTCTCLSGWTGSNCCTGMYTTHIVS